MDRYNNLLQKAELLERDQKDRAKKDIDAQIDYK